MESRWSITPLGIVFLAVAFATVIAAAVGPPQGHPQTKTTQKVDPKAKSALEKTKPIIPSHEVLSKLEVIAPRCTIERSPTVITIKAYGKEWVEKESDGIHLISHNPEPVYLLVITSNAYPLESMRMGGLSLSNRVALHPKSLYEVRVNPTPKTWAMQIMYDPLR